MPPQDLATLAWACSELQTVPTAALLAELLEVLGSAMERLSSPVASDDEATSADPPGSSSSNKGSGSSGGKSKGKGGASSSSQRGGKGAPQDGGGDPPPLLAAPSLALLARSLVLLGVVPDASWQLQYRRAVRELMPSSSLEELSLMAYSLLHFGGRPSQEWTLSLLKESLFKMDSVGPSSLLFPFSFFSLSLS